MDFSKIIERAKNICLDPKNEWPKIAEEQTDAASLYTGYAMILAAIPAIAMLIGSLGSGIVLAAVAYVIGLAILYVVSIIVNLLAPTFDGTKNDINALKVVVYAMTPGWLAGIFNIIPFVGPLIALLGSLYGIYLLYLGLAPLMKNPQDKSIGYTALIVVCYIVLTVVIMGAIMSLVIGGAMMGAAAGGMFR